MTKGGVWTRRKTARRIWPKAKTSASRRNVCAWNASLSPSSASASLPRAHAEAEASLLQRRQRPFLAFVSISLLVLLAAACGFLGGLAVAENRQNRERADRLAKALSHINATVSTNTPSEFSGADRPASALPHRNVSVVVIQ